MAQSELYRNDHPDNGRARGRQQDCWEDVYPTSNWASVLAEIWDDHLEYERLAELARRHAGRLEFQPEAIIDQLIPILGELTATRTDAPLT